MRATHEEKLPLLEELGFDLTPAGARLLGRAARFIADRETAMKLEEIFDGRRGLFVEKQERLA
jgi:hypothetical protein